jgi:chromosome segregation ATPase
VISPAYLKEYVDSIDEIHIKDIKKEVNVCHTLISDLSSRLQQQDDNIILLREEINILLREISETRTTLKDVIDKFKLYVEI